VSFDNQNKIIRQNNPIDYIEEYFSRFFDNILRDSEDKVTINAKGCGTPIKFQLSGVRQKKYLKFALT